MPDQSHLKPFPTWDNPRPNKHFVQYFGHLKRRRRGGHDFFHDELYFINGKGGFKFPKLEKVNIGEISNLQCIFRRLLNDGNSSIRYEFGLTTDRVAIKEKDTQNAIKVFRKLVSHICHIPIQIKNLEQKPIDTRVIDCSKKLSELYEKASATDFPETPSPLRLVTPGEMCILLEYHKSDFHLPGDQLTVAKGLHLSFKWIEVDGKDVGVFFLEKDAEFDLSTLRKIRIGIMRTYSEHQNLTNVLNYAKIKDLEFIPDKLSTYLNEKTKFFNKQYDLIKNLILSYYSLITPAEILNIEDKLDSLRLQVKKKVWDHLGDASLKYLLASGDLTKVKQVVGQLISKNKIKEAIAALKIITEQTDNQTTKNSVTLLESRLVEIELSVINGTIGFNDLSIAQNKLRLSIMKLASMVSGIPQKV